MTRALPKLAVLALAASLLPLSIPATGPFDQRLSPDRQIVQALNRLTFGPRPGDVEEVRRIGLAKWMDLQLHPDRIPENPVLEERLKPLETVNLPLADVIAKYSPDQNMAMMMTIQNPFDLLNKLPPSDRNKIMNGAAEDRTAVLDAMDPETRHKILGAIPENIIAYTPKYKEEAEKARKEEQEARTAQLRKRNPQLRDLVDPDQIPDLRSGNKERVMAAFSSLDPEKRAAVAGLLPPASQAFFPEYRRQGMMRQSPRLVAAEDLKQARVYRAVYSNRQLQEVLVDFWLNHFNVDSTKNVGMTPNQGSLLIGSYERDAIRPYVLGHFKDMLLATARHPAMLYYLDNGNRWRPTASESAPMRPAAEPSTACPIPSCRMACSAWPTASMRITAGKSWSSTPSASKAVTRRPT
jgi:hypothetical protein